MMKKLLIFLLLLILLLTIATPVAAFNSGAWSGAGNSTGDGEPPGWSIVNPGNGGSDGPGEGPGAP